MPSNYSPLVRLTGATLTAAASYMLYRSIQEYGWSGTIRYIWVGDPYPDLAREYLQLLEKAAKSRSKEEKRLNEIEEALDRARLDSVDDTITHQNKTTKEIVMAWIANYPGLEKALAQSSHTLDRVAAQVDGVLLSKVDSNSKISQNLKRRKKHLSKQLVLDMELCDALMVSYQVLQEEK